MFNKSTLLLFFLFSSFFLNAQEMVNAVTVADLQQRVHPADTTAPAAYIYRKGKSWFEFTNFRWLLITEVSCRIKVYKPSGYDYANEEVVTYNRESDTDWIFTNAFTYNLNDTGIEKARLEKESIFAEEKGAYVKKSMKMPNVHVGSIVEFTYKTITPVFLLAEWDFQQDIPVDYSEYEISIPEFFTFNRYLTGFLKVNETQPQLIKKETFRENKIKYTASCLPVLKEEAYVNNIRNYIAAVRFELAAANYNSGEEIRYFSTDWQAVATSIYEDENFGKQLEIRGFFKGLLHSIIDDKMTRAEKIATILKYIQQKMTWNGEYGYICDTGIKKAYAEHAGNVADINLMLINMFREAGLEAHPVLVSTRSHGLAVFPSRISYNYVIAAVIDGGNTILLDATTKYSHPDILPFRALNDAGRMIIPIGPSRERRFFAKEVQLYAKTISKENTTLMAAVDEKGVIIGRGRAQHFDYFGYAAAESIDGNDDEKLQGMFEKRNGGIQILQYQVINKEASGNKPVVEEFSFSDNKSCEVIGERVYISPVLFLAELSNPLQLEARQYPVDFIYPFRFTYQITIEVPHGYTFEHIPENKTEQFAGNLGEYNFAISVQGNIIQIHFSYGMNTAIVYPENYQELKAFFDKFIEKQNEKIVLKKHS